MCGIYGEISFNKKVKSIDNINNILQTQNHRGPDDNGFWVNKNENVLLAHNRLSIIDLSIDGHQPMSDKFGNTIVFNGEIYNYIELKKDCISKGYQFQTNTDTEVILALYYYYEYECLKYLRGMFSFAIWDSKKEECFIARDRIGKKPLNYSFDNNRFVFSSEINTLIATKLIDTSIDNIGLNYYLQFQFIPAPYSIYKSIKKLEPAHYMIIKNKNISQHKYWDVNYQEKLNINENEALELFEESLKDSINIRLRADVPVGAFLSGGIDSSLIVALMSKLSNNQVNTFSIGFKEAKYSELDYAKMVADKYNTNHQPIILNPDIENLLFKMPKHYGEPFGDKAAIAAMAISESASKYVKVVLNGDGGDELLGGYPRYKYQNISNKLFPLHVSSSDKLLKEFLNYKPKSSIVNKIKYQLLYPELQTLFAYNSFFNSNERDKLIIQNDKYNENINQYLLSLLSESKLQTNNNIDRMLYIDNHLYLSFDGMPKMDIASMAYSLEARSPFIDHKLMELSAKLPYSLKVKNFEGKYLIKKLAEKYLQNELIYRQKQGFTIPVKEWLKKDLRDMVYALLLDKNIMEPLNTNYIKIILNEFYIKNIDYSKRIWLLLNYAIWKTNLKDMMK